MAVIKIILLILLGIVLLIVALILLALFFPFTYTVKGKGDGSFRIKANVHWLFYFFSLSVWLAVGGEKKEPMRLVLRVLGIPLFRIPKKERRHRKKKDEPELPGEVTEESASVETGEAPKEEPKEEPEEEQPEESAEEKPPKKKSFLEKGKSLFAELKDERNKAAVKKALTEAKKMLKVIFPKRLKMNLVFSAGDPANTGKALGALAMFPPVYKRGNRICPDFEAEKAYVSGTFSVRGRIILITLVIPVIRLLRDRNVRRIIGKIRKKA